MFLAKYMVEFTIYAFAGWLYECIYCSVKSHHWSNRGFLYGPVCPIYGFGALLCSIVFGHFNITNSGETPLWEIFIICVAGSAVLEYSTSYFLEKRFNALWWDYSNIPFNIHGRICLPASLAFGGAGVIIVRFILPLMEAFKADMNPVFAEILAMFFIAVFAADTALTVDSLADLTDKLDSFENEFNNKVEEKYIAISEMPGELKEKYEAFAAKLTGRQRYALASISKYTDVSKSLLASKIRSISESLGDRISRMEESGIGQAFKKRNGKN